MKFRLNEALSFLKKNGVAAKLSEKKRVYDDDEAFDDDDDLEVSDDEQFEDEEEPKRCVDADELLARLRDEIEDDEVYDQITSIVDELAEECDCEDCDCENDDEEAFDDEDEIVDEATIAPEYDVDEDEDALAEFEEPFEEYMNGATANRKRVNI